MSALDGWFDVCRTGARRDTAVRETAVADTFPDRNVTVHGGKGPTPAVAGHHTIEAPAFFQVVALHMSGSIEASLFRDCPGRGPDRSGEPG